jgi:outer membrane immunogenic protein
LRNTDKIDVQVVLKYLFYVKQLKGKYMKKTLFVAAAAAALAATPAMANPFTGVRAEVTAGADDVTGGVDTTDVAYGAGAGFDAELYKNVVVGVEATLDNVFDRRNIGASARFGYVVADKVLVYGKVGYANWKQTTAAELEGLRVGGGLEAKLVGPVYGKVEYRYTDFNGNVGQHGGLVGVGLRF